MPKKSNLFSNFFGKSRSGKLVSDAVPFSDNNDRTAGNDIESPSTSEILLNYPNNSDNDSIFMRQPSTISSTSSSSDVIPYDFSNRALQQPSLGLGHLNENNNSSALSQTQGYNVYQFSQINGLHIGSVTINAIGSAENNTTDRRRLNGEPIRRTKTIDAMMKSSELLNFKMMDIISTHLGEGWRDVMRHLSYSDGQIEQQYEEHYPKGIKEIIYQFLLDYSRNDEAACLGHLTKVLWKSGHKETVYILKEYWKNSKINENKEQMDNGKKSSQMDSDKCKEV